MSWEGAAGWTLEESLPQPRLVILGAPGSGKTTYPLRCTDLSHNKVVVTLETLRARNRAGILQLASRHGARNVRIFGSVARGEATAASDLDLLVDWEPGRSLLDHVALAQDLEELLGTKVHIGTEKSLHWYVRERILREASPL